MNLRPVITIYSQVTQSLITYKTAIVINMKCIIYEKEQLQKSRRVDEKRSQLWETDKWGEGIENMPILHHVL